MRKKIFIALITSMTLIITASLIILAALQTNTRLPISADPEKIKIFYRSQSETFTYTKDDEEYAEIVRMYNDSFKKSYLNQITTGQFLNEGIAEATDQKGFDDTAKLKGLFIEFTYSNNQRLVINRDGNTRQIFISGITLELTQEKDVHAIYIHYAEDGKYNNVPEGSKDVVYPLTTVGDTRELYIYLRGLIDEKEDV